MKINKKNNKKTIIFILLLSVISIVTVSFSCFYFLNHNNKTSSNSDTSIDYNPPTDEQKKAGEDIKKSKETTASSTLSINITAINSKSDPVQIRTIINGIISNNDTCELSLTKDGTTISKTVSTYALPSSSTCQGFDIDRSELSSGTWGINISVTAGNETANATGELILE